MGLQGRDNVRFDYRINEDETVTLYFIRPDKHIEITLTKEQLLKMFETIKPYLDGENVVPITYGGHASGMTHGEG